MRVDQCVSVMTALEMVVMVCLRKGCSFVTEDGGSYDLTDSRCKWSCNMTGTLWMC